MWVGELFLGSTVLEIVKDIFLFHNHACELSNLNINFPTTGTTKLYEKLFEPDIFFIRIE